MVHVVTDGSAKLNPGKPGWGTVIWKSKHHKASIAERILRRTKDGTFSQLERTCGSPLIRVM
jgi:ribonuclease HI